MKYNVLEVHLVDFGQNVGNEFAGKHYALILTPLSNHNTLIVAPITSKKKGKKYKGGFTIDTRKYQKNPTYEKVFVYTTKIREIDKSRILSKRYTIDNDDASKLKTSLIKLFGL